MLPARNSVDAWDAAKLYLWFDQGWWRKEGFRVMRITTDLPPRKLFAFDEDDAEGPSIVLAAYTDGADVEPWAALEERPIRDGRRGWKVPSRVRRPSSSG